MCDFGLKPFFTYLSEEIIHSWHNKVITEFWRWSLSFLVYIKIFSEWTQLVVRNFNQSIRRRAANVTALQTTTREIYSLERLSWSKISFKVHNRTHCSFCRAPPINLSVLTKKFIGEYKCQLVERNQEHLQEISKFENPVSVRPVESLPSCANGVSYSRSAKFSHKSIRLRKNETKNWIQNFDFTLHKKFWRRSYRVWAPSQTWCSKSISTFF